MSQADGNTTTRRHMLAASASLAVVPVAAVAAQISVNPDAELLVLGAKFDELMRRMAITEKLDAPYQEALSAVLEKMDRERTGPISGEEYVKAFERVDAEYGHTRPSPSTDDISDALDPVIRGIHALPAPSVAGLRVKARVAKYVCVRFWDDPDDDADWDKLGARKAIDAVLSLPETPA
jgi:hypothetical protein